VVKLVRLLRPGLEPIFVNPALVATVTGRIGDQGPATATVSLDSGTTITVLGFVNDVVDLLADQIIR
jgi:hypothetical protein